VLAIISDLHLTDGSGGTTVSPGAFVVFAERLRDLAFSASWRSDGRYRPIERIDVLLLGDILDLIRSTAWLQTNVRPWHDSTQPEFAAAVTEIARTVLAHNRASLQVLRGLAGAGAVRLPPANAAGQPAHQAESRQVDVRMHYMVGNHDWFLHLPGGAYDGLRGEVARHMGLANRTEQPFPHAAEEDDELAEVLRRHGVLARHGEIFDPFNFEGDRNGSSLGDCLVIELLNRFSLRVEQELGEELPATVLLGLRELDNIRPLLLAPVWIDGLLERACPYPAQRRQVKQIWDRLADEFLELPFVRERDTWKPNELVDGLQRALKFSQRVPLGWASWIVNWLREISAPADESLAAQAMMEREFRNRRARHIVYGHTHHAECVPLDASYTDVGVLNQVYFNAGTWRRVYRQTRLAPQEQEFIAADEMHYLAFFQGDERSGRPYETWSGTLGLDVPLSVTYRLDAGGADHAGMRGLSASNVQRRGPHFSLSPARARRLPSAG
jgi:UDP-2,3-diacylglucosamine pyrophosphatase LpxH